MKTSSLRQSFVPLIPNLAFYEQNETRIGNDYVYANSSNNFYEQHNYGGNSLNSICSECGECRQMVQCLAHCNHIICEGCRNRHWYDEVTDLMNIKVKLEDNVANIRKYLCKLNLINKNVIF